MLNFDLDAYLGTATRTVSSLQRDGQEARAVTLARSYDTGIADLWEAVTSPPRLARWFLPVEGELKLGGRYQLQGNAGGRITACEPPRLFDITWEFGDTLSWVELRLAEQGEQRTRLTLSHIALLDEHWQTYGPGAAGVGWELGLLGLLRHLETPDSRFDEAAFAASPPAQAFLRGSSQAWGEADIAAGEAAAQARAAAERTAEFYTAPPPEAAP